MTAIAIRVSSDHAIFAADTLQVSRHLEFGFCSKVLALPHLRMMMVSQGSAAVTDCFYRYLQRNLSPYERHPLDGPEALRDAYQEYRDPVTDQPRPTRVFLAGIVDGEMRAVAFGSPHFIPESLPTPTYLASPPVEESDWGRPYSEPEDFARMIQLQKQRNYSSREVIGNHVTVARLDLDGTITMFPTISLTGLASLPEISGTAPKSDSRAATARTPTITGPLPTAAGDREQARESGIGGLDPRRSSTRHARGFARARWSTVAPEATQPTAHRGGR